MRRRIYDALLEWKQGRKGKSAMMLEAGFATVSLDKCVAQYASHLAQPYIIHTGGLEEKKGYLYIPPYMVPCL